MTKGCMERTRDWADCCGERRRHGSEGADRNVKVKFSSKTKFEHNKKAVDKSHVKVGDRAGVVGNKLPTGEWMANSRRNLDRRSSTAELSLGGPAHAKVCGSWRQ
jgi:hypothetical protein